MPIRLNLLAEDQALEEARRRDTVKRAMWAAALLVALMLAWGSSLQLRVKLANGDLGRIEAQVNAHSNEYRLVLDNQKKIVDTRQKLAQLHRLATNRFLNGTLLDALQHTTVEEVQLLRLKIDQTYAYADATKPRTNNQQIIPGKPPTATERMVMTLDASDSSLNPGDQVNRFKEAIATNAFFLTALTRTNGPTLKSLSPPQVAPATGKPCVLFSLECRFPEKIR
jgi:hypothetical protein